MSGVGVLGEVAPALSLAVARMEVDIAFANVEAATEPGALTEAFLVWWQARQALRDVLIGVGA